MAAFLAPMAASSPIRTYLYGDPTGTLLLSQRTSDTEIPDSSLFVMGRPKNFSSRSPAKSNQMLPKD